MQQSLAVEDQPIEHRQDPEVAQPDRGVDQGPTTGLPILPLKVVGAAAKKDIKEPIVLNSKPLRLRMAVRYLEIMLEHMRRP